MKAARLGVEAAESRVKQAGVGPASTLTVEAESFAGSGDARGFDSAEATVQISRQIETGGKRALRVRVATAERDNAALDDRAQRLNAWRDAVLAFTDALAARRMAALADDDVRLFEEIRRVAEERNAAGKVSPLDVRRAETELALVRATRDKVRQETANADAALSALWGEEGAEGLTLKGELVVASDRSLGARASLDGNPDLKRLDGEIAVGVLRILEERAANRADVEVSAGVVYAAEPGEYSLVAGVAFPLQASGRNRHGIAAAEREHARRQEERRAAEQSLRAEFVRHLGAATTAASEIAALRDRVLPSAESTLAAAREGYSQGKFGYLDLLEAERSLVEIRRRLVETQADVCKALAEVARLIGDPGLFVFFRMGGGLPAK